MRRRAGARKLAHWREAGAWWAGECPVEVVRWREENGRVREARRELPIVLPSPVRVAEEERQWDDISLRPRKTRDEKVAMANGAYAPLPEISVSPSPRTYAPVHVLTGLSFGRSVLLAREVPRRAADLGIPAAVIADRFALTGAVEFVREAKACGVKPLVGATFEMDIGGDVVLVARDKHGYQSLSALVTECHLSEPRLYPLCTAERLRQHSRGLSCLTGGHAGRLDRLLMADDTTGAAAWLDQLVGIYGVTNVWVEVERSWCPWGSLVESRLRELAASRGVAEVAGGAKTHARLEDFAAQDVALCAESLCTVDEIIGRKPRRHPDQPSDPRAPERSINGEQWLRSPDQMVSLFRDRPELLDETMRFVDRCDDDVLPGRTRLPCLYPDAAGALHAAAYSGASERHSTLGPDLRHRIDHELERISRLGFADHFLAMWDACEWARENGIHYSGRGSVVDSAVAYCLGISRIDAHAHNLHFDRFLPEDGSKRPDIDVDFEARRRDDVRSYFVRKYGTEHVATVSAIGAYCTRGIVREVGKALGLSAEAVSFLAKRIHGGIQPEQIESALESRPELKGSGIDRNRLDWLFRLAHALADVPRNLRAHSSGIVVSDRPIAETVPVQWSGGEDEDGWIRVTQWDKRSIKYYFDKFDLLCLRGQDVLSGTERRLRASRAPIDARKITFDDENTYRAMRSGELVGIPQSASPAMRQAHMRLRTADLHDASLVQAGIRPGVGGAVKINELIARRRGLKPYRFEHPELERILGISYGIIVFQEQVDQLLQTFAGFSSGEAEDTREAIHKRRREDYGSTLKEEIVARIVANGFSRPVADHVFELVSGFKGYGFAQGHALAFAEISLRSIFCQQNYPAEYFAALLDAQPAGYYGSCTLVNEARSRGVAILPVDVNVSGKQCQVEDVVSTMEPKVVVPGAGVRLALGTVKGLTTKTQDRILSERGTRYASLFDFAVRARPDRDELESLVLCGALDGLWPHRRDMLWAVPDAVAASNAPSQLWDEVQESSPLGCGLPDFTPEERVIRERSVLGLDVEKHLMAWEREAVAAKGGLTCDMAKHLPDRTAAFVVGNPIRLRFPPTPSGKRVVFFDLEDESGLLNVTCFDAVYRQDGHAIVCAPYVTVIGRAQWRDGHTAFLASRVFAYTPKIHKALGGGSPLPVTTGDFLAR